MKYFLLLLTISFSFFSSVAQHQNIVFEANNTSNQVVLRGSKVAVSFSKKEIVASTIVSILSNSYGDNKYQRYAEKLKNITLYVCIEEDFFRYNSLNNTLIPIDGNCECTFRANGRIVKPPVTFYFIADFNGDEEKFKRERFYLSSTIGFISHDISNYCKTKGMLSLIGDNTQHKALTKSLRLKPTQKVLISQAIGYISAN